MRKHSFILDFLISPGFRPWRHLLLIFLFFIMSVNQAFMVYRSELPVLGNKLYLIIAIIFLNYICLSYVIIYLFLPKLLSTGKYIYLVFCIVIAAILLVMVPYIFSVVYLNKEESFSAVTVLDKISSVLMNILGISGAIFSVFLKNWIITNERVGQLEKKRLSSEVEQLKEQITPSLFFNILNKTGTLVKTEPDRASAMLMKLSRLLRYQLYDCNRNKVLLSAEISFLRNFLEMEHLYSPEFRYSLNMPDNLTTAFIPPSVVLPFVQSTLKAFTKVNDEKVLDIHIKNETAHVLFMVKLSGGYDMKLLGDEFVRLRERLNLLLANQYELIVLKNDFSSGERPGKSEVSLKLYTCL